ncbi:hypothetical protein [Haliangium sp.]|uniref:hypothetical protein n=1 Tax=Haliangium sp. TaxID=2663208 RepID=UPI003D0A61D3
MMLRDQHLGRGVDPPATEPGNRVRRALVGSAALHLVLALALVAAGPRLVTPAPGPAQAAAIEFELVPAPTEAEFGPGPAGTNPGTDPAPSAPTPAAAPAPTATITPAPAPQAPGPQASAPTPAPPAADLAPPVPPASATASVSVGPAAPEPGAAGDGLRMRIEPRPGRPGDLGAVPRRPGPLDLSPSRAARLIEPDPGPAPPRSPLALPPGQRRPGGSVRDTWRTNPDGSFGTNQGVFTARIERDGRVTMKDAPNLRFAPGNIRVEEESDPGSEGTPRDQPTTFVKMTIAEFDITDWVMRAAGQDPYLHRKARFLDRTREARAAMSIEERRDNLRDALAALPGLLEAVWRDPDRSPAQRRRDLFRLWDECAERGDDEVVRASRSARATIIAFIRRRLPADSPHAYSEAEIADLQAAGKSTQRFAPYD